MDAPSYLHDGLKHGDEDKLYEADLSGGLCDFVPVHERGHWETLGLFPVALGDSGISVKGRYDWSHGRVVRESPA